MVPPGVQRQRSHPIPRGPGRPGSNRLAYRAERLVQRGTVAAPTAPQRDVLTAALHSGCRVDAGFGSSSRDLVEGQGATADFSGATTTGHGTGPHERVRRPPTNLRNKIMCSGCVQPPAITTDPGSPGHPQDRGFTLRTRLKRPAATPTTGPRSTFNPRVLGSVAGSVSVLRPAVRLLQPAA